MYVIIVEIVEVIQATHRDMTGMVASTQVPHYGNDQ